MAKKAHEKVKLKVNSNYIVKNVTYMLDSRRTCNLAKGGIKLSRFFVTSTLLTFQRLEFSFLMFEYLVLLMWREFLSSENFGVFYVLPLSDRIHG